MGVETHDPRPGLARLTAGQGLRPAAASVSPEEVRFRESRLYVDLRGERGRNA